MINQNERSRSPECAEVGTHAHPQVPTGLASGHSGGRIWRPRKCTIVVSPARDCGFSSRLSRSTTSWFSRDVTPKRPNVFSRRLLKGLQFVPRVIVTDKLRSYGVAHRALFPKVEYRQGRYLINRAENSLRPTRPRRMADATIQITPTGPGLSFLSRIYPWPLPPTPTPDDIQFVSRSSDRGFQHLAAGGMRSACCVTNTTKSPSRFQVIRKKLT